MAKVELKQPIIEEISKYVADAKAAVLVDYRGLTVEQDTKLRKSLREGGVVYKVYKNTYLKKAFAEPFMKSFPSILTDLQLLLSVLKMRPRLPDFFPRE